MMAETLLNTIRENLIGEDQARREKTKTLLRDKKYPFLTQMVLGDQKMKNPEMKKMLADSIMSLVKTMTNRDKTQGSFRKVTPALFQEMTKY
jgi:hypothetical protein